MEDKYASHKQSIGVKKVLLFKQLASKIDFWLIVVGIILVAWAKNWEGNTLAAITPQVVSNFDGLNISSALDTLLYILVTVLLPMYSKAADLVGRAEAFVFAIFFYIISGIVMACSQNIDTLLGGQVLYGIGLAGVSVLGHVLIADMTTKVNRGLYQAFYDVPALMNLYVSPILGQYLWSTGQWRVAYSLIPICLFGSAIPLFIGLFSVQRKMNKSGLLEEYKRETGYYQDVKKTVWEKICWIIVEIDIIGSAILAAGLCLFLLPFILAVGKWGGWSSPTTLGCLITGFLLLIIFVIYEKKFATKPIIPLGNWVARPTPIFGVLVAATVSMFHASNWNYFLIFLQVSKRLNGLDANYVSNSYHATFLASQVLSGYLMKHFKVYRPIAFTGLCLLMISMGMMIASRTPDSSLVFIIFSQIIGGFGAGWIYVPCLIACQSSVPHEDLAVVTALFQIGGTLSTSIGSAIAGAIFTNMLPIEFEKNIPGEYDYATLAGDIAAIQALPEEQWSGVATAYGNIQRILSIVSLCFCALAFMLFFGMKSFGLTDDEIDDSEEEKPEKISTSSEDKVETGNEKVIN